MASQYTPEIGVPNPTITLPSDGDPADAESVNVSLRGLADYMKSALVAHALGNLRRVFYDAGNGDLGTIAVGDDGSGARVIVAGGNNGVYTSRDGETWTQQTYGGSFLSNLIYGGGLFLGSGSGGSIYTSGDAGVTWVERTTTAVGIDSIAYDGTAYGFVSNATGTDAGIWRSTDGLSWSKVVDDGTQFLSAAHGNGVLLAGSSDGQIYRSTDNGQSWTAISLPGYSDGVAKIAYGNGVFVSTASGVGFFVSEDDGVSWTEYTDADGVPDFFRDLEFGSGLFMYCGGMFGGNGDRFVGWSKDGKSWHKVTLDRGDPNGVTVDNGRALIVGDIVQGGSDAAIYDTLRFDVEAA